MMGATKASSPPGSITVVFDPAPGIPATLLEVVHVQLGSDGLPLGVEIGAPKVSAVPMTPTAIAAREREGKATVTIAIARQSGRSVPRIRIDG
jgi:hypothetical protein